MALVYLVSSQHNKRRSKKTNEEIKAAVCENVPSLLYKYRKRGKESMADTNEKFFPFRSVAGDRKYSAEDWAAYFALFLSNGVFYSSADKLKVVTNEGMKVKVNKGAAFINGRGYRLETDKIITLDTADGVLKRIDRIVLRCDYSNRQITTEVIKGSYSQEPVAKELTRDADVYELALADVYVAAGVVEVTTANITDQRLNTTLCGIVTGLVDQADTTEIFNQFQAYMLEFEEAKEEEFNIWFNTIKATLEGDVAGNLQKQITNLQEQTGDISELKTENKTDLVAAINELAEKEPDLLETMAEVEENTTAGKYVDALAVKELNNCVNESLGGFKFYTNPVVVYGKSTESDYISLVTDGNGNPILADTESGRAALRQKLPGTEFYADTLKGDYRSVGGADSVTPFSSDAGEDTALTALLALDVAPTNASTTTATCFFSNDEYFDVTDGNVCTKACSGTVYIRWRQPIDGSGNSTNVTLTIKINDETIYTKTTGEAGRDNFEFSCEVGDVVTMTAKKASSSYGRAPVTALFISA